jgi:hypothetical protein
LLAMLVHHSISGVYETNRLSTIEGVVMDFQFVNPHPFMTFEVKSSNGGTEQWRLDFDNHHEMVDVGFTSGTLKSGDRLKIIGNPARRQSRNLYVRRLDRPADGFTYRSNP